MPSKYGSLWVGSINRVIPSHPPGGLQAIAPKRYFSMLFQSVSLISLIASVAIAQPGPLIHTDARVMFDLDAVQTPLNNTQDGPGSPELVQEFVEQALPGIFTDTVSVISSGAATASAVITITDGYIDDSAIISRGTVNAMANRGAGWAAEGRASYTLSSQFAVSEATSASLSGTISIERPSPGIGDPDSTFAVFMQLNIFGFTPGPIPNVIALSYVLGLDPSDETEIEFFEVFDVAPGGIYTYQLNVTVASTVDQKTQPSEDFTAEFGVSMLVGDRDGDGLLDRWETHGIDIDGDGIPEIELPAMGADPDRKDLFVEIDTHTGSNLPLIGLDMVIDAFANAPVPNPVGPDGITLHLLYDESDLTTFQYDALPDAQIAAQKLDRFGTPSDRAHPLWDNGLRDARLRVFRYCVWGGTTDGGYSGWAEIPGDDSIVALDDPRYAVLSQKDRASVFMHELGHNLGLRHGGGDEIHRKPNYLSVMNYMFIWPDVVPFFVNAQLDYSRDAFASLNESALFENTGMGAPASYSGRFTFFNSAPPGDPMSRLYVDVTDPEIDWDNDLVIGTEPIARDLNLHLATQTPTPGQLLHGHNDWSVVRLPLAGSVNFGKGASLGETTSNTSPEPTIDDLLATIDFHSGSNKPCPADFNGDGVLNFFDVASFVGAFQSQDPSADFNNDGLLNFFDFSAFINAFNAGCP